ncbi:MAG: metallo-dependent hydrolase [Lachnospiraceae bacterium]|nr:metallo-dependent hydrolase [Lachnospiraceae bacterium]
MDFLIKNGTVYDPARHLMEKKDVALVDGVIAAPEEGKEYRQVIDAEGCIVTTGLIDYHVHYMRGASEGGVNADVVSACSGITTAVDGGTAGTGLYEHALHTLVANSQVRFLNYLLVASGGQSNNRYPENLDPALFDEKKIVAMFKKHPDNLVGLKTRISNGIIEGELARESVKRTVEIAEKAGTRVIVHVTDCSIPLDELADMLRPGDVICHIYQGKGKNICLGEDGKVLPGLLKARERGVLFDASNGRSNYDLTICQAAVEQGFVPDVISSDINESSCFLQPLHSLPRILSKYLDFGMSLEDVLDRATIRPAELIGMPELGSMAEGTTGDVVILKLKKKDVEYCDINGNTFIGHQVLVPQMTFMEGECVYCQADFA